MNQPEKSAPAGEADRNARPLPPEHYRPGDKHSSIDSYANWHTALGSACAICACVFLLVGKGFAAGDDFVKQQIVNFSDLNVNSTAGVAALYGRIHRVAGGVCYVNERRRELALYLPALRCAREAEAQAVTDINNASLTAYYHVKMGPSGARTAPTR